MSQLKDLEIKLQVKISICEGLINSAQELLILLSQGRTLSISRTIENQVVRSEITFQLNEITKKIECIEEEIQYLENQISEVK